MHITSRALLTTVALVAVPLTFAACGDDAAGSAAATTIVTTTAAPTTPAAPTTAAAPAPSGAPSTAASPTPATASAPETTAAAAPELPVLPVEFADYSFTVADEIPAGSYHLVGTNQGTEVHHLTLARVHDGVTIDELFAAFAAGASEGMALVDFYAGPNNVAAGASHGVDVELPAGQYVAMCVLPSPDGVAHVDKGMLAFLTVTEPTAPAPELDTTAGVDATITLFDYAFAVPAGFAGGRVELVNAAGQPHELAVSAIGPGGSYAQFTEVLAEGKDPSSLDPDTYPAAGGVTSIAPDGRAVVDLDLPPGHYAFVCYVPDSGDGRPHHMHGMVQEVVIEP